MENLADTAFLGLFVATVLGIIFITYFVKLARAIIRFLASESERRDHQLRLGAGERQAGGIVLQEEQ